MTQFMSRLFVAVWLVLLGAPILHAEQTIAEISESTEDDKGFITRLLQEKLSGAGRQVSIDGFAGALSSRATFTRLTIADDDGVWITLENGAISWTRTALLHRRVSIQELSAERIILPRLPGGGGASTPTPEAREFSLPVLPVSVNIDHISAGRVELGAPIIGQEAALSIDGAMNLENGEGATNLKIQRLDGPRGQFALETSFSNTTRVLKLALDLDEAADGLFTNIVKLDGKPAVKATITGEGPLNEFQASMELATDGQPRITGGLAFHPETQDGDEGTGFQLNVKGDIAALMPQQHKDFFGANSTLAAEGWRGESGRIRIPKISITTDALNLAGSLATTAEGAPESAQFRLNLGEDAQASQLPARLPWLDKPTTVRSGSFEISYDAATASRWTLRGRVGQIERAEGKLDELRIDGAGRVDLTGQALDSIHGWVAFGIDGLEPSDPALADALGDNLNGGLNFNFAPGNELKLSGINVNGTVFNLKGDVSANGLATGITLSGDLNAGYHDLSHISGLAKRKLSGAGQIHAAGSYTLLGRGFDGQVQITGTDITLDQPQADRLLAGQSQIAVNARRDKNGIALREFSVRAQNLSVDAKGQLSTLSSDIVATISMPSLAAADPAMSGAFSAEARLSGPDGARKLVVNGMAQDLVVGQPELDGALKGETALRAAAVQHEGAFVLEELRLENPQLMAEGKGSFATGAMDAKIDLKVTDLADFNPNMSGPVQASATAVETNGLRKIEVTATGQDLRLGAANGGGVNGALTGTTQLNLSAEQQGQSFKINDFKLHNDQMDATAQGVVSPAKTDMQGQVNLRSLASFGQGWRGAIEARGSFTDDGTGGRVLDVTGRGQDLSFGQAQVDGALAGETELTLHATEREGVFQIDTATIANPRLNIAANGQVGAGASDVSATLNAADLRFLGNGLRGALQAQGRYRDQSGQRHIEAQGNATGLALGNPKADALLRGTTAFDLAAAIDPQNRLSIEKLEAHNPQLQVSASGDPGERVNIRARLADLELLAPGFGGAAEVAGSVAQGPQNFDLDLTATAPGDVSAKITGTVARDGQTMDLRISGAADAAIANPSLRTRSVQGPINFDLRMNGKPSLEALSGTVRVSDARLADPKLGLTVSALDATVEIAGARLMVEAQGQVDPAGTIRISGPIALSGDQAINLDVAINGVVLRDPNLYETRADGTLKVGGALGQGVEISGRINLDDTELRIPSTGFGGVASIPAIKHLYDRPPVRATRAKAGLSGYPSADAAAAGMSGPAATPPAKPAKFDIVIAAPHQVFVRGRGVDAELGGEIRLTGTSRQPIPIGRLELIRGRVDLLGKRFDLAEGLIELQGSLVPVIRLVAEAHQDGITTRIIIDGEARNPEIKFESSPEMPQEEVMSHLLFGRGLDHISPLQAAQLANAVAVLAGKGGEGIVGRLRKATGLDDLDLSTDETGEVSVRAGKYLSKNLYTDVQLGANGETRLNLNLDVSHSLTARGSVDSSGDSTIGIFYDRDY